MATLYWSVEAIERKFQFYYDNATAYYDENRGLLMVNPREELLTIKGEVLLMMAQIAVAHDVRFFIRPGDEAGHFYFCFHEGHL